MQFLLTRPSRGATNMSLCHAAYFCISTHTPLAGRDGGFWNSGDGANDFYSHAPRGARRNVEIVGRIAINFYSHAPRGARRMWLILKNRTGPISTHTPLAGRDPQTGNFWCYQKISTHTPLAGRDLLALLLFFSLRNFYSHAPRGARPLHLACNSESFPTYRGADFFIIKSSQFCRFIRYLMPLFQANLPGFLHHLLFPYHFIHAGIRNTK